MNERHDDNDDDTDGLRAARGIIHFCFAGLVFWFFLYGFSVY